MKRMIDRLTQEGLRGGVKVMIGGAPVTQDFADEIGADGYSDNAAGAVNLARQLMAAAAVISESRNLQSPDLSKLEIGDWRLTNSANPYERTRTLRSGHALSTARPLPDHGLWILGRDAAHLAGAGLSRRRQPRLVLRHGPAVAYLRLHHGAVAALPRAATGGRGRDRDRPAERWRHRPARQVPRLHPASSAPHAGRP